MVFMWLSARYAVLRDQEWKYMTTLLYYSDVQGM
jgi:hypothetical protein